VQIAGDPRAMVPRVRAIAASIDPSLRLDDVQSLEEAAWNVDVPMMVGASAIVFIVGLGLFLSAAGIFALMSVNVARRTREIGLRTALGATRTRLLFGVLSRAAALVGSGVLAGNLVLLLVVTLSPEAEVSQVLDILAVTSAVMLIVGLLACVEPARRALRIQPIDALKQGT
jgi:ABC-type antimicrobial peptide transport system permease subunit